MTASMVRILGLFGATLLLASCSGPLFSKIEVKASPTVYAALGNAKANISDYVSVGKIREILKSSPDVQVFDYQEGPTDTTQRFLVHYPLTSVELDFGQYMKNLKLDSTLSQALAPGTFTIPSLDQTKSQTGSFDINSTLTSQVNGAFSISPVTFVETGLGSNTATLPNAPVSVTKFSSATFSAGSLNLTFDMPAASTGLVLTATVALVDGAGTVITTTASPVNLKSGTAVLPLAGRTLPSNFNVKFTATTSGGVAFQSDNLNITAALSSDIAISAASGITLTSNVTTPTVTIPVNSGGKLVSATIAANSGKITINLAPLPAGWTGFTRSTTLTLKQGATTLAQKTNDTSNSIVLDLGGQTLTSVDITLEASSSVTATNASFTGLNGPISVNVDAVVSITKFSLIKVSPGADFKANQKFKEPISQQMLDWVDAIYFGEAGTDPLKFGEVGIEFDITNSLPAGNDMTIVMSSTAFAISGQTPISLVSGQTAPTFTQAKFTNKRFTFVPASVVADADGKKYLDFSVDLVPNGYNSGAGTIDLVDIVPGTSLSVGGTVKLIADWTKASVTPKTNGAATGFTGTFPSDGSKTDLSQLNKYLGAGINFASIPASLYLSFPDPNAINMKAKVVATYNTNQKSVLVGTPGTPDTTQDLSLVSSPPTFPTGDFIGTKWTTTASKDFTLDAILNAKPSDLVFSYELNLSSITVNNDPAQTSQKIQANLVVLLPLTLEAKATSPATTAPLGVDSPLPADDMFGRKVGSDNSNINNMLDKLVSMNMAVNITNKSGMSMQADLSPKNTLKAGTSFPTRNLTIPASTGVVNLTLSPTDIKAIRDNIPFSLTMAIGIPDDNTDTAATPYSIQRGGTINANITVNAVTDINQTFTLGGTN